MSKKFPDKNKGFKANFLCNHQVNVNDEKLSVGEVKATLFCDEFADTIFDHGCCTNQILNIDETCLNYKMLLGKTLAVKVMREAPGAKKCKECVTNVR